jgi:hypothetical protein
MAYLTRRARLHEVTLLELCQRIHYTLGIDRLSQALCGEAGELVDRCPAIAVAEDNGGKGAQAMSFLGVRVENYGFVADMLYKQPFVACDGGHFVLSH